MRQRHMIITKLSKKYDNEFHFFRVKPINEMVYDKTKRLSTIAFKDILVLTDYNQYLKRYYFLKNASSRNQIVQRIRMLVQFYEQNLIMRYEYPTMIVTNTKTIFMKRIRRMKKMTAMEDSSDFSSEEESDGTPIEFSSSVFLVSLDSDVSKSSFGRNSAAIILDKMESQGSVYEIYEGERQIAQERLGNQKIFMDNYEAEESLSHLICDFDQIDVQMAFKNYSKALQQTSQQSQPQKIQQNQRIARNSHIVITPIDYVPGKYSTLNNFLRKGLPISAEDNQAPKNGYKANYEKRFQEFQKRSKFASYKPEATEDFYRPDPEMNSKTQRHSNEKYNNETYATRNNPKYRNLNTYRSSNHLEAYNPWKGANHNPLQSTDREIVYSPPQGYRYPEEQQVEFRKDVARPGNRKMRSIKEKALALLNGVQENYRSGERNGYSHRFG